MYMSSHICHPLEWHISHICNSNGGSIVSILQKCSKWFETRRNAIEKNVSGVTYIAFVSLWQISLFGHQSKFSVTADFEHSALDHAASQNKKALQG